MKSVAVSELKARCLELLHEVARTGEPLARVVPSSGSAEEFPQEKLRVRRRGSHSPRTASQASGGRTVS